jgi:hypothetical protein
MADISAPHDLRATLATMRSAKEKGVNMNVWDRDIKAVELALLAIEQTGKVVHKLHGERDQANRETLALERENVDLRAKLREAHQDKLALWEAIAGGPGPRCRDCADFSGRCQGNGLPCDPQARALEQIATLRTSVERARTVFDEISDLGADGATPARLGNIAHAAWIELSSTECQPK